MGAIGLKSYGQGSPEILWQRRENSDRINTVAFSSDGRTFITGSSDRLINFWNTADGTLLRVLNTNAPQLHESSIESVAITSDGTRLATGSYRVAKLWRLPAGTAQNLVHSDWVVGVAFSPDGSLLATACFDRSIRIWRSSDGAQVRSFILNGQMRTVAFSPDGNYLAGAGGGDFGIRIWKTSDWSLVRTNSGNSDDIYNIAFSPNSQFLASGGYDQTVKVWNTSDGSLRYAVPGTGRFSGRTYAVAFNPDSTVLAFTEGEGNAVRLARVSDGAILRTYNEQVNDVEAMAFSPGGLLGYGRALDDTVVMSRVTTAPVPSVSSPRNGETFVSPATIAIAATASKSGISKMEFYQNGTRLGEDRSAPYVYNWTGVSSGTYVISVVETDSRGTRTSSGSVDVMVRNPQTSTPQVTLAVPNNRGAYLSPAQITVSAAASAASGVARVEFYQNGVRLGDDVAAPYGLTWNNVGPGDYVLRATVVDRDGNAGMSEPITISVANSAAETVPPRVSIVSPASGARVTGENVILRGAASDNVNVAQVLFSQNGGSFKPAEGTTRWQATVPATPGINTLQVKSVDAAGNESPVVTRKIFYVVASPLTLTIQGNGIVSPNLNGRLLEEGRQYAIRAVPAAGYVFSGWGDDKGASLQLVFTMQPGLSLRPEFVPNPFIPLRGVYRGLILSDFAALDHSGYLMLSLTPARTFSARLQYGGSVTPFTGRFSGKGLFSRSISRRNGVLEIALQLDLTESLGQITGTVSDGILTSTLTASRTPYNFSQNPAPQAGRYTTRFVGDDNSPIPQGHGFGLITIDKGGIARITGATGDGVSFTHSGAISRTGKFPVYAPLYGGRGALFGELTFAETPFGDLTGSFLWTRPAIPTARSFRDGFSASVHASGSKYITPPAGVSALTLDASRSIEIQLMGGNLESSLTMVGVLSSHGNTITVDDSDIIRFRGGISPVTGLVTGSFQHPVSGRSSPLRGVVLQKQNSATGFFPGLDQTGSFTLAPAP